MKRAVQFTIQKGKAFGLALIVYLITYALAIAQDGNAGINEANTKVQSYFNSGTNLMYAIGAVLGLIGTVKLYSKLNKADSGKVAVAWFGSCVFLAVAVTVIR